MNIITKVKEWFNNLIKSKAEEIFNVAASTSPEMEQFIVQCSNVYKGNPKWLDEDVKTLNFAKTICSETARLTTLGIEISITGSARAEWLQKQMDNLFKSKRLRHWIEYGLAYGTILLKPNGNGVDVLTPFDFIITEVDNGVVMGAVCIDRETDEKGKIFYTRLEYNRFIEDTKEYQVTNYCYKSTSENSLGASVDISDTPWFELAPEVTMSEIESPLFGVLTTPQANNIDIDSALGLPIFAEALTELEDLDIAYSKNSTEIKESDKIVLLDSDRLFPTGGKVVKGIEGFKEKREKMKLPHYVRNVFGDGTGSFYQEINPQLNTQTRLEGINALLSQIAYKCGYSNGYFVFNAKTGMVTATQVESDDRRTIQLIKDIRDGLEECLNELIYALNVFADLYDLAPQGEYDIAYNFDDITYNVEEDRARWYSYVIAGKIPFWYFLTKFEGFTEKEAKALEDSATPQELGLFEERDKNKDNDSGNRNDNSDDNQEE